jgi:hypothetical protein
MISKDKYSSLLQTFVKYGHTMLNNEDNYFTWLTSES